MSHVHHPLPQLMMRDGLRRQFNFPYMEPRMIYVMSQLRQNNMEPIKWRRGYGYTDLGHLLHDDSTAPTQCAQCHKENPAKLKRCGECKFEHYCSRGCQARHWKTVHKLECQKIQHILRVLANVDGVYDSMDVLQALHGLLLVNDWLSTDLAKDLDLIYRDVAVNIIHELCLYPNFIDALDLGHVPVHALISTVWAILEHLGGRPDQRQRLASTELMYMLAAYAWQRMCPTIVG
jgi:hypothetical protein